MWPCNRSWIDLKAKERLKVFQATQGGDSELDRSCLDFARCWAISADGLPIGRSLGGVPLRRQRGGAALPGVGGSAPAWEPPAGGGAER